MIAPMALYKARRERSRYGRAFWAGLTLATFLGAFFCYNRGVWVAMAAALLVLLLERQYRRIMIPVILIGLVVALVYWQAISESAVVTERLSNVSSIRFRVNMLEVSRKIIRDSWLFGVGVDNFSYYYLEYGGHWETLAYDEPTPHSTYISVLATMGVVSLIPYVLIFLSMFLKLARLKRRSRLHTKVDAALLVSSMGVIAVYAVSSAAVDLHINAFTSQVFFLIMGTVLGYVSERRSVGPNLQEAKA
jgi:O-antigen ligase